MTQVANVDEWRSKRLGRKIQTNPNPDVPSNGGGAPDLERVAPRHPMEGMGEKFNPMDLDNNGDDEANLDPAPQNNQDDDLRQQLAAAQGRLGPAQRQIEEMRATMAALQQQVAEQAAALATRNAEESSLRQQRAMAEFNPFDGLEKDQLEMLDPAALKLIEHVGRNAYAKAAGGIKDPEELIQKVLSQRDKQDLNNFISATAESLSLSQLGNDNKFNRFLADDDSAGLLLNSFVQAKDIATARMLEPRVRSMIKRYEKATNTTRTPDPQDRAAAHLARAPGGQQHGSPRGGPVSADQVKQITEQARRLARAGKHKEANALLASINN